MGSTELDDGECRMQRASAHRRPRESAPAPELPAGSMPVWVRRLMGLLQKAEMFMLEARDDVHGKGKDWSSEEESEADLSFLITLLYHPCDQPPLGRSSIPLGVELLSSLV